MDSCWSATLQHWCKRLPLLARFAWTPACVCKSLRWQLWPEAKVSFALCTWPGTGEVEQDFAFLQMYAAGKKGRTSSSHLWQGAYCQHVLSAPALQRLRAVAKAFAEMQAGRPHRQRNSSRKACWGWAGNVCSVSYVHQCHQEVPILVWISADWNQGRSTQKSCSPSPATGTGLEWLQEETRCRTCKLGSSGGKRRDR